MGAFDGAHSAHILAYVSTIVYLCIMADKMKYYLGHNPSDESKRQTRDYYATSPEATKLLLKAEKFNSKILEPCCGDGYISKVLEKKGYEVISTDLYDYGYGLSDVDFLDESNPTINELKGEVDIITNVPYAHSIPMLMRALDICKNKVAMLFPITYIPKFYFCKPSKLYIFPRRITVAKNGDFNKYVRGSMSEYGWFVWYKGYIDDTVIRYLDNIKQISPRMQPYVEQADQTDYWNLSKESKKEKILALYQSGMAKREIARIVGQSESCVRKWLKQME